MDNYSTDNSVEIAKKHGCSVFYWENTLENGKISEHLYRSLKNNKWKENQDENAWIVSSDMDEWIDITDAELLEEEKKGVTIIDTTGFQIVGESKEKDLSDIDLLTQNTGYFDKVYSKKICFKVPEIREINFDIGAHTISPVGNVKYSEKKYIMKHLNYLGENYLIYKYQGRNKRLSDENKRCGWGNQYTNDVQNIKNAYQNAYQNSKK